MSRVSAGRGLVGQGRGLAEFLLKITGKNGTPRGTALRHYYSHSLSWLNQTSSFDFKSRMEKIILACKIPVWGRGLKHTDNGDV